MCICIAMRCTNVILYTIFMRTIITVLVLGICECTSGGDGIDDWYLIVMCSQLICYLIVCECGCNAIVFWVRCVFAFVPFLHRHGSIDDRRRLATTKPCASSGFAVRTASPAVLIGLHFRFALIPMEREYNLFGINIENGV